MYLRTPSSFFKSHLLVVLTGIMIQRAYVEVQPQSFTKLVDQLLGLIANVNSPMDSVLRRAACQCLLELELSYPGLLLRKTGHLFAMAQKETGHIFQDYAALFVTAMKHAVRLLTCPGSATLLVSLLPSADIAREHMISPPALHITVEDMLSTTREKLVVSMECGGKL